MNRHDAGEILRKGFAVDKSAKSDRLDGSKNWEEAATAYQLEIERWVIDNNRAGEMARKAYVSHVRAYATHIAKEREIFDVKSLHLGHLAKAFALRERPGKMGRGGETGLEKRQNQRGQKRRADDGQVGNDKAVLAAATDHGGAIPSWRKVDIDAEIVDGKSAAKRMRVKMKEHMAVASEFNIG